MASASKKADGAGKPPQPPPLEMIPIPWPLPKELPAELRAVYLPPTPVIGGAVPVGVRYSASRLMLISVSTCTHDGYVLIGGMSRTRDQQLYLPHFGGGVCSFQNLASSSCWLTAYGICRFILGRWYELGNFSPRF